MSYCTKCGFELNGDEKYCPSCGCATELENIKYKSDERIKNSSSFDLKIFAKIFMIIGCFLSAFAFLFPLLWTVPMTLYYIKKIKNHEPVSTEFKICSLLFVNVVAGILMLVDQE